MYLTRMELDTRKRNTMKALFSPNLLHGAIEAAFSGERLRKLWRIDHLGSHCYILILSERKPQMEHAAEQFGISNTEKMWETKEYSKLLERIKDGTIWHFRLTANPTKSCKNEYGVRGTVHAHITPYYQKKWLLDRCEKNGFAIKEDEVIVTQSQWQRFYKGAERRKVTILSVTYEGTLIVTDTERFQKALVNGIGRGKAYGMGMLTVVKAGDRKNE